MEPKQSVPVAKKKMNASEWTQNNVPDWDSQCLKHAAAPAGKPCSREWIRAFAPVGLTGRICFRAKPAGQPYPPRLGLMRGKCHRPSRPCTSSVLYDFGHPKVKLPVNSSRIFPLLHMVSKFLGSHFQVLWQYFPSICLWLFLSCSNPFKRCNLTNNQAKTLGYLGSYSLPAPRKIPVTPQNRV